MVDTNTVMTSGWSYLQLGLDKLREAIMWIATMIAKYIDFPADNIYLVLIGAISVYLAMKFFYMRNTNLDGRWMEFLMWAAIIFLILKYL